MKLLKELNVGIIRDGLPGSCGARIAHELSLSLKDKLSVEEIMCGDAKTLSQIKLDKSIKVITYRPTLSYTLPFLKHIQLSLKMPKYDIYHFRSPLFIGLVRYKKP